MPDRKYQGANYRFGFNGKENDNEVKGIGNEQDYGMRIYDPRIGRFLSVDPLTREFPWYTPYQFAGNKPIYALDLDGAEELPHMDKFKYDGSLGVFDWLKAIPNAAGDLWNTTVVDSWNSGVAHYKSVRRGTWSQDVGNEFKSIAKNTEEYLVGGYKYHSKTPIKQQFKDAGDYFTDPQTLEDALTIGAGFYLGNKIQVKGGNVLKNNTQKAVSQAMSKLETAGVPNFSKAKWAQPEHSNTFSKIGQEVLGTKTIDDAVAKLKNGTMQPSDLPIDFIVRNNETYILNTRSSVALTKAGIDRSKWNWVKRTKNTDYELRLDNQLKGSSGYSEVTNTGTGEVTKH